MLKKYFINILPVFVMSLLLWLCGCSERKKVDTTDIHFQLQFNRFEKDLIDNDSIDEAKIQSLKKKYGEFFFRFCGNMMRMHVRNDSLLNFELNQFIKDSDIKVINGEVMKQYSDLNWLKDDLAGVFKNYKYHFPKKKVPAVVTYIGAFNYRTITTDSVLGIGLDFYLGGDCPFYHGFDFPQYMLRKFNKNYIVVNTLNDWYQSDYDVANVKADLLSQMVYYGKMQYYTDMMAPEMPDTIKLGYTAKQLQWCQQNEVNIWTAIVENQMLFSTDMRQYNKFIQDGNTTNGFPKDAPAKTGQWIGWQMVKKYMDKNPDVTLEQLLKENDANKILNESKYKPTK